MTNKAHQSKLRYRRRMKQGRKQHSEGRGDKTYAYVYIMGMGDGLFKVGWTFNVQQRLKEFLTSNPLVKLVHAEHVTDARRREKFLHDRFNSKWVAGEWFRLTDEDVAGAKEYLASLAPPLLPPELAYRLRGE
jgi:hypothetical protein